MTVLIGVVISFVALSACSDETPSTPKITDVYAFDVSVEYDGKPHSIVVLNTQANDKISYSTNNVIFYATPPAFTDVGVYTVYFKVNRTGYAEYSSYSTVTISPTVLSDISAENVTAVYDGQAHSITIVGTEPTDKITYSTDGVTFSQTAPTFTDVGKYSVFYRVQRAYGNYSSSCVVTILPNIYGRYFNQDYGLIVIEKGKASVNSKEYSLDFDVSGNGFIGDTPFSVENDTLSFVSAVFKKLSDSEYVYKLVVGKEQVYFCAGESGALDIVIDDDGAKISIGSSTLITASDANYCESAQVTDYINLAFCQEFSHSDDVTEISISLSLRPVNPLGFDCVYVTYDGLPHGFNIQNAVFIDSDGAEVPEPSFTDVGKHTAKAVIVSDEYLPLVLDCTMVIMPNIDGVYYSESAAMQIADGKVFINNELYGELTVTDDEWACNGKTITVTDDGIEFDGIEYTETTQSVLIVDVDGEVCLCFVIPKDALQVFIRFDGNKLTFTDEKNTLAETELECANIQVSVNDKTLTPIESEGGSIKFALGKSDINSPIVKVKITGKN